MTKDDIVEKVEDIGFPKKESIKLVEVELDIFKDTLETGDALKIPGFGKFEARKKAARKGRNPHTGEKIIIFGRRVLYIQATSGAQGLHQ